MMLCYVYVTLCSYHVMLCYIMLCFVMLFLWYMLMPLLSYVVILTQTSEALKLSVIQCRNCNRTLKISTAHTKAKSRVRSLESGRQTVMCYLSSYAMLCHVTWFVLLCNIISHCVILCYLIIIKLHVHHVMFMLMLILILTLIVSYLSYVTLCYVTLRYFTLRYVALCYYSIQG